MLPSNNKTLLRLHRYAGLITAPLIVFFAISGVWQVYRLQQSRKDGSYTAPKALRAVSDVHMAEHLDSGIAATAFKLAVSAASAILLIGTLLGVTVGLRMTRPPWLALLLLAVGTALPLVLYLLARS